MLSLFDCSAPVLSSPRLLLINAFDHFAVLTTCLLFCCTDTAVPTAVFDDSIVFHVLHVFPLSHVPHFVYLFDLYATIDFDSSTCCRHNSLHVSVKYGTTRLMFVLHEGWVGVHAPFFAAPIPYVACHCIIMHQPLLSRACMLSWRSTDEVIVDSVVCLLSCFWSLLMLLCTALILRGSCGKRRWSRERASWTSKTTRTKGTK